MIAKAYRDLIKADAGIVAQLATFDFGSGSEAAIFSFDDTQEQPPDTVSRPAIFIRTAGGVQHSDRGSDEAQVITRISVWGDRDRQSIRNLARDVWVLVNKASLTLTGWAIYGSLADPPAPLTDPDDFPGFLVNSTAFAQRVP